MCYSSDSQPKTDYKHLIKAANLTFSQKRLFYAICKEPTVHLYGCEYQSKHQLTHGGTRSGIKKLLLHKLIARGAEGTWTLTSSGMQKWLAVVLQHGNSDYAETLRHGSWP
jgi:hypothetical protein